MSEPMSGEPGTTPPNLKGSGRSAAANRSSEEKFTSVFRSALDGIVIADDSGNIILWNPAAQGIFKYTETEIIGRPITDLMPVRYRNAHREGFSRFLKTREGQAMGKTLELHGLTKDGVEFPIELSLSHWRDRGRLCFTAIIRDITIRKYSEEALRRSHGNLEHRIQDQAQDLTAAGRDMETLLSVITHDLKEPARTVQNFSQLLQNRAAGLLDEKSLDYLNRMVRAADRLHALLDDISSFCQSRRISAETEPLDLEGVIQSALKRLEGKIQETRADVHVFRPFPDMNGDRMWALEAVFNLIENAIKFVAPGSTPNIDIEPHQGPRGAGLVVKDRGTGVASEHAERIFLLFQRCVGREIEGTGAGLAIVHEVAVRHGGKAWVEPREGGGSKFYITFGSPDSTRTS